MKRTIKNTQQSHNQFIQKNPTLTCVMYITYLCSNRRYFTAEFCTILVPFSSYCFLWAEKMFFSSAPQSETPTVSFQGHHITMQPAFTVRLRAPQANWTPHKASDNCCPPTVGLSAGTLYQVLNAAAAMNAIIGGGVATGGHHRVAMAVVKRWGGVRSLKPHKNS